MGNQQIGSDYKIEYEDLYKFGVITVSLQDLKGKTKFL